MRLFLSQLTRNSYSGVRTYKKLLLGHGIILFGVHNMYNMSKNEFWARENECDRQFAEGGPYFFITTEDLDWMLYETREEFIVGTNIVAISKAHSGFSIMDEVQMNNHIITSLVPAVTKWLSILPRIYIRRKGDIKNPLANHL